MTDKPSYRSRHEMEEEQGDDWGMVAVGNRGALYSYANGKNFFIYGDIGPEQEIRRREAEQRRSKFEQQRSIWDDGMWDDWRSV